jgi:Na+/melibiose symporter-like transporter
LARRAKLGNGWSTETAGRLPLIQNTVHLLGRRRFLPLFVTQALGAFNDNLFKTAMVLFVVYNVFSDPKQEEQFSALATAIFIIPFFLLSALAGQLADANDKAKLIRIIKTAEIGIMLVGATGLFLANIPVMLVALFAMGIHSTFFGPIKYALMPQHLQADEVLGGYRLVYGTMHIRRLFLAIISISFFWAIGAVLFIQFPPLVKNVLNADKSVASLFLAIFSVGIAIGSVVINRLLKSEVSARYAPGSVIVMGLFVLAFHFVAKSWEETSSAPMHSLIGFAEHPGAPALIACLLGIAIAGGMFVVPLYAFLTTTVPQSETARTVAANNLVNSGAMVIGSGISVGLSALGVSAVDQFLLTAAMCVLSAWLAWKLHLACD